MSAERRYSRGVTFEASYTVQKNLGLARVNNVANQTGSLTPYLFDPAHDRGPIQFDVPQKVVMSGVWSIPLFAQQ